MLLPDAIHPKDSIYYTGAIVLKILQSTDGTKIGDLYVELKKEHNLTFPVLLLTLDWLYLINAATINQKGEIVLCS
jgi:hypothetical protein